MTIAELAHTAAAAGPFRSWAASYGGPTVVNRPGLGQWSVEAAPGAGAAALTARDGALCYEEGGPAQGFIWRSGILSRLSHGEVRLLEQGDRYLICTDDLLDALDTASVTTILAADEDAPAERLVLAALAAGELRRRPLQQAAAVTIEIITGSAL